MRCLLCDTKFAPQPTWTQLLYERFSPTICTLCEDSFERCDDDSALFMYNEAMKDYLHRYKFLKDVALAHVFRQPLHEALKKRQEIIVPVPLHAQRLQERTFSQVHELLDAADIKYADLLEKVVNDRQAKKTKQQRLDSKHRFSLQPNAHVEGCDILVIDDILTTGATLADIRQLLRNHGASKVLFFTLIRAKRL